MPLEDVTWAGTTHHPQHPQCSARCRTAWLLCHPSPWTEIYLLCPNIHSRLWKSMYEPRVTHLQPITSRTGWNTSWRVIYVDLRVSSSAAWARAPEGIYMCAQHCSGCMITSRWPNSRRTRVRLCQCQSVEQRYFEVKGARDRDRDSLYSSTWMINYMDPSHTVGCY